MKDFLNAAEAKSKSYEALDNFIKQEFDKVHESIIQAVESGDFKTLWKVSESIENKHVSRIIELLNCNDFAVYNDNDRYVSINNKNSFENFRTFNIRWDLSYEEAEKIERNLRYNEAFRSRW